MIWQRISVIYVTRGLHVKYIGHDFLRKKIKNAHADVKILQPRVPSNYY